MKKEKKDKTWEAESIEETSSKKSASTPIVEKESSWKRKSGELAVDVYDTGYSIVIQCPIAGVKKEDLEIITEKDMVIIKGHRSRPGKKEIKNFYTQECFYGDFKKEVILPEPADFSKISATMEEGVLMVEVPKTEKDNKTKVNI